jgi:hypothetical protein
MVPLLPCMPILYLQKGYVLKEKIQPVVLFSVDCNHTSLSTWNKNSREPHGRFRQGGVSGAMNGGRLELLFQLLFHRSTREGRRVWSSDFFLANSEAKTLIILHTVGKTISWRIFISSIEVSESIPCFRNTSSLMWKIVSSW